RLDGEFSGQFPSGNGAEGGDFAQFLGFRPVVAPTVVTAGLGPASGTQIPHEQDTNQVPPAITGPVQIPFPGTVAGLSVALHYIPTHPGGFDLRAGAGGRGLDPTSTPDQFVQTNAAGQFTFTPPFDLRDGFQRIRIVVVGDTDAPPLPGLASTPRDISFRV